MKARRTTTTQRSHSLPGRRPGRGTMRCYGTPATETNPGTAEPATGLARVREWIEYAGTPGAAAGLVWRI